MEYRSHKRRHSRREPLSMTELCDVFKKRNDEIFLRNSEHSGQPSTSSKPPTTDRFEKERNRSVGIYAVNEMQKRLDCNSSQELSEGKRVNLMKQEISQYQRNVKRGMSQEVQRKIPENLQGLPHEQKHEERQKVIDGRMLSPIVDMIPQNQRYSVKETPQIEGQHQRGPKGEKANEERKKSEGRRVSQVAQEMPKQQRLVVNCPKQSQHHKKEPSRRIRKSLNEYQGSAKKEMSQDEWMRMTTPTPSKTHQKECRPKEEIAEKTTQGGTSEKHHWMAKEEMFKKAKEFNEIARKLSQRFNQQDEKERLGSSFQEDEKRSNAKVMVVIDDEKQSVEFFIEM